MSLLARRDGLSNPSVAHFLFVFFPLPPLHTSLATALTCEKWDVTAKTAAALYSVHILIWLFGEFTLAYLVCAGALTVPVSC